MATFFKEITFLIGLLLLMGVTHAAMWQRAKDTLKLVQVIMRHGDRNPIKSFPKDPNQNNPNYFQGGFKQLTNIGVKQTHDQGVFVRARYDGFIPAIYDQKQISCWSSTTERSIRSGDSFLRGLFPKPNRLDGHGVIPGVMIGNLKIGENDHDDGEVSQIVPLATIPRDKDYAIYMKDECPSFERLEKTQIYGSEGYSRLREKSKPLMSIISQHTGMRNSLEEAGYFLDYLIVQMSQNKTLYNWTTPEMAKFAEEFMIFRFGAETGTPELKRLRSAMVKNVVENLKKKVDPKSSDKDLKLIFYSGHDRTIVTVLNILGMFDHLRVPYASMILIELHQQAGDYFVEFYYRNDTNADPYKLEMPRCPNTCPLSKFRQELEPIFYDDYDQMCTTGRTSTFSAPVTLLILGIFLFFFSFFSLMHT